MRHNRILSSLVALIGLIGVFAACGPTPPVAPDPVVIVAGTVTPAALLEPMRQQLIFDGYTDVTLFELADLGTANPVDSAQLLQGAVDGVLARTGATKVDIVSHSQGGIVTRYYLKHLGGSAKVDTFVSLSAPNNGAIATNVISYLLGDSTPANLEAMTTGSAFLNDLNSGVDVAAPVKAFAIYSANDEVVNPPSTSSHDVGTNVLVQSQCPLSVIGHVGMIYSRTVYSGVRQALAGQSINLDCLALPFPI